MKLLVRRLATIVENRLNEAGQAAPEPLCRAAVIAVVQNPYVDGFVADLAPLIEASAAIGVQMAEAALRSLDGRPIQSYGKGGLVGTRGEQEHANALLTTTFAEPFRAALGGQAWISSVTKIGAPGASIDIPLNCKDDVYVRSHYDAMTFSLGETPMPDEIALIFCMTSGARLNARVGGLTYESVQQGRSFAG